MKQTRFLKLFWAALCITALLLPSCRRTAERAARNIRIEAVESVQRHALSGIDLTLRVRNGTGYKLVLRQAELDLWYKGKKAGGVILREGVEVPRRTTASICTRWKLRIDDPVALFLIARRIRSGDLQSIAISYRVEGRGGPARINISQPAIPLTDFLRIFGLTTDKLKPYFEP